MPPPVPRDVPLRGQQDGGQEPGHRLRPHPRPHRRGQHARHGHRHEPTGTYLLSSQMQEFRFIQAAYHQRRTKPILLTTDVATNKREKVEPKDGAT